MQSKEEMEAQLKQSRATKLTLLFSPACMAALREKGVELKPEEQAAYRKIIEESYQLFQNPIIWGYMKKSKSRLPYTLDILGDEPYLRMHNPEQIKESAREIAAKPLLPLAGGSTLFAKIFRDPQDQRHAKEEHDNYNILGIKTVFKSIRTPLKQKDYLFQPFYEGRELLDALEENLIPSDQIIPVMRNICMAVKEVHEKGYLHLDLKPENMIYNPKTASIHLIDFESMMPDGTRRAPTTATMRYAHPALIQALKNNQPILLTEKYDVFTLLMTFEMLLANAIGQSKNNKELQDYWIGCRTEMIRGMINSQRITHPIEQIPTLESLIDWTHRLSLPQINELQKTSVK